ncbi:Prominin [Nesidiocoris tenuis]|uniref:Prominin n=1 Tax=Nesidiocoris tenuis TaxID=355587 RepID=A0ABN7BC72_9HEMI|nr:Prominin [Nesidiocoris tenuis]
MSGKGELLVFAVFLAFAGGENPGKNGLVLPNPEQNVMPFDPVQYSPPNVSNNYQSSTKINARGMGHLYFITRKFMDFVLDPQAFPEGKLH